MNIPDLKELLLVCAIAKQINKNAKVRFEKLDFFFVRTLFLHL